MMGASLGLMLGSARSTAAAPTNAANDTFDRGDAAVLGNSSSGGAWSLVASGGTWGISSGKAYAITNGGAGNLAMINTGSAIQDAQIDITAQASQDPALTLASASNSNLVQISLYDTGNYLRVYQWVAGTGTLLAFDNTIAFVGGTTYTVRATKNGTAINVWVNGVLKITTVCDASLTSTNVGIRISAAAGGARWDNLVVV
jgi:hypothetical protein